MSFAFFDEVQLEEFDISSAFRHELSAGADPVHISVDVELEHIGGIVRRAARITESRMAKAKRGKV